MHNFPLSSVSATHYTEAIAPQGVEIETFPGLPADGQGQITVIEIKSIDNLAWQIEIMNQDGEPKLIKPFAATDATQYVIDSVTYFFYSANVEFPISMDTPFGVKVAVRNMSDTAKTVGANMTVTLVLSK